MKEYSTWQEAVAAYHKTGGYRSTLSGALPAQPTIIREAWRNIARLRAQAGDKEGAARARRAATCTINGYRPS